MCISHNLKISFHNSHFYSIKTHYGWQAGLMGRGEQWNIYTPIPKVSSLCTSISSSSSAMACRSPQSMLVPSSPSLHSPPFSGHSGWHTSLACWGREHVRTTENHQKKKKKKNQLISLNWVFTVSDMFSMRWILNELVRTLCTPRVLTVYNNIQPLKILWLTCCCPESLIVLFLIFLFISIFFLHLEPTGDGDFPRKVTCFLLSDSEEEEGGSSLTFKWAHLWSAEACTRQHAFHAAVVSSPPHSWIFHEALCVC